MTYELAERLKEAGFPFRKKCDCPTEICVHQNYPTLEELIEELKGKMMRLWIMKNGQAGVQLEREPVAYITFYPTLEEALVEFYIASKE